MFCIVSQHCRTSASLQSVSSSVGKFIGKTKKKRREKKDEKGGNKNVTLRCLGAQGVYVGGVRWESGEKEVIFCYRILWYSFFFVGYLKSEAQKGALSIGEKGKRRRGCGFAYFELSLRMTASTISAFSRGFSRRARSVTGTTGLVYARLMSCVNKGILSKIVDIRRTGLNVGYIIRASNNTT